MLKPKVKDLKFMEQLAPFPDLPDDLKQEMFEAAAYLDLTEGLKLSTLSQAVRRWLLPIIFSVISIVEIKGKFQANLIQRRGHYIRHLRISLWSASDVKWLRYTPNVENLVLLGVEGNSPAIIDYITNFKLRRISADISLLAPYLDQATFSGLTHFDIHMDHRTWSSPWYDALIVLPSLTHLAVSGYQDSGVIKAVLTKCPNLVTFVIHSLTSRITSPLRTERDPISEDAYGFAFGTKKLHLCGDPRVVVIMTDSLLKSWKIGARGGDDYWRVAERIVQYRLQSGEENLEREEQS
ncbi:hypothetical protein BDN72DRAFT_962656 [Pluteus cervinus]|uniref:Uncharacterized protein n=1 Tax=Pluteus cervinus TaxID=181527 RepID=A0ACD3AH85_9AGAR|nr:hypothetical protein BDN72DRAFT_962656 [Pluteus cervinus]